MVRVAALATLALASGPALGSAPADVADFDFVTAKVEANYSGWSDKTAGPRRAELDALTARLRKTVAGGSEEDLRRSLQQWVGWFDDGHLQLQWTAAGADLPWRVAPRPISEAEGRARLAALGERRKPIEGLWSIDDRYRLLVLRQDGATDRFDAIIVSTSADGWKPGDVKAVLSARPDGGFALRYGAGDRTEVRLGGRLQAENDILEVEELGIWRRVQDDPGRALAAEHRWPGDAFAVRRIDADTLYMRLPSFNDRYTATLKELVATHAAQLAGTPQLIIDVRGNGGGSDFVYAPLLPFLQTRAIWRPGVEIRVSPDNSRLRRDIAERLAASSPESARLLREESERMIAASGSFIRREPPLEVVPLVTRRPQPARIAVLIDRAGSSAENFIMDARQSGKVVLMGQENSAGIIDYGEMMSMPAPSGRFTLAWATTRSLRLPNDPVDPDGIAPDVRIPRKAADPVAWTAQWLKGRAVPPTAFGSLDYSPAAPRTLSAAESAAGAPLKR